MNGFIPCIDTGKKTHRYIVLRTEVEKYIERRKNDPSVDAQLQGKFGHEVKKQPVIQVSDEKCEAFGKYLRKTWSAEPEALPAVRVAELVGIHRQRIYDLCRKNAIFYIMIGDRMICGKESVKVEGVNLYEKIVEEYDDILVDKKIKEIAITGKLIILIKRGKNVVIPKGDTIIRKGDILVINDII
jgi:hypothetical protein